MSNRSPMDSNIAERHFPEFFNNIRLKETFDTRRFEILCRRSCGMTLGSTSKPPRREPPAEKVGSKPFVPG